MRIFTSGKPNKIEKNECKKAVKFYCTLLLSKRILKKLKVRIVFLDPKDIGHNLANCEWIDTNHSPREFEITINNNLLEEETLMSLAHECVHIKQYAKNELKDLLRTNKTSWYGKVVETDDDFGYWDTPWEIEAYGKEKGLYMRFIHSGE